MTEFQIGDVVRIALDKADAPCLVVQSVKKKSYGKFFLCVSECGKRVSWAESDEIELVHRPDPQVDIKQAIREVLLSDDFMKAFAAAWMKTPLPLAMQYDNKDGERIQSLADYPFGEPSEGGKQ